MKKLFFFVFAIATLGAMASCGGDKSSGAGKAAEHYAEYIVAGDYDKFLDGLYIEPGTPVEEVEQGRAIMKSLFVEKGSKTLEEKGGIKTIEALSEEVAEDGATATVKMCYTFHNGETDEENWEMRLDNGEWKMDTGK